MPTFNDYPSSRIEVFDLQDIQRQSLQNQLRQSKLQEYGAAQQQQNQLRGVMGGVGAEAGLGPNAQQALRIDPGMLDELLKIPKAKRDRAKEQATTLGNLALGVLTAPEIQRTVMWGQAREAAIASGANPQNVPEAYDQGVEVKLRQWVAQAGKIKTLLDQVPDTPSGYRGTEGGLEFTPGGPADPAQARRLAEAKRAPGGADRPAALQIAEAYKAAHAAAGKQITDLEALKWAKNSVNDTPQKTWTKVYTSNRRDVTMDEAEARKIADEITAYIHGEGFGAASAAPTPAPGGASLSPVGTAKAATPPARSQTAVTVPIPPEQGAPAPRRKPAREKSIETMTKDEAVALIYGGRELSQDEIDRLDARLEALGVPR